MMADLGLTEIQWGWVLAAFLTGYTLFQLPGGMLGDRFGPRVVLTGIAVLWSVFTAATALVPDLETASIGVIFTSLILVRFMVGVVHAPVYPATNPAIVRWFPVGGWALPNGLSAAGVNLGVAFFGSDTGLVDRGIRLANFFLVLVSARAVSGRLVVVVCAGQPERTQGGQ